MQFLSITVRTMTNLEALSLGTQHTPCSPCQNIWHDKHGATSKNRTKREAYFSAKHSEHMCGFLFNKCVFHVLFEDLSRSSEGLLEGLFAPKLIYLLVPSFMSFWRVLGSQNGDTFCSENLWIPSFFFLNQIRWEQVQHTVCLHKWPFFDFCMFPWQQKIPCILLKKVMTFNFAISDSELL